MQTHNNVLSDTGVELKCKIKAFASLEELFIKYNWTLVKNELVYVCFQKIGNDYDFFEIRINQDKIDVTIPLKNSRYKYITHFDSYFAASEYIEMHLLDYESSSNKNA
jgi:hypothetical protein